MKTPIAVALFTSLSLSMLPALADDTSPPPPLPAPAASPATASPVATSSSSCRLGDHAGVDDVDAQTAAQLVCTSLSRAGAPAGATFRVDIGRLGSLVLLTVSREASLPGSTSDSREARLRGVEDVPSVAPKLAYALVNGTPVDDADVPASPADRRLPSGGSRVHFAMGLDGQFPPFDRGATPAPGITLEVHSELEPFQIVGNVRFGGDSDDRSLGVVFFDFSMGARYFPGDGELVPYIGAGFAWSYLSISDNVNDDFDGNHTGLGVYGEAGIEFLHLHHTHLAVGARLDAPFYALQNDRSGSVEGASGVSLGTNSTGQTTVPSSIYYAPLSLELRLTF
jgi:hypothetical protein